jgi:hypothetical protein
MAPECKKHKGQGIDDGLASVNRTHFSEDFLGRPGFIHELR